MQFIKNTTWQEVFEHWRLREAKNSGWVDLATKIKGWPDWESWRKFTASQISAERRQWEIFQFTDPMSEIPQMLIGPYSGWQSRLQNKNQTTFKELLDVPEQCEYFNQHQGVKNILNGLPFATEFIGLIREDNNKIVCLEGHHRATAIALAKKTRPDIDFTKFPQTIAIAHLPVAECSIFDEMLNRGTSKNPQSNSGNEIKQ